MSGLIQVATYQLRTEADLAVLVLQDEGIPAMLFDTAISAAYGGLFIPVRLMVPTAAAEEALVILVENGLT